MSCFANDLIDERDVTLADPSAFLFCAPFFLYAETHYRFRYFLSFLKKAEPELIADTPHFIERGKQIPLLLLCKDADRYPCSLQSVRVIVNQSYAVVLDEQVLPSPVKLDQHYWWRVVNLDLRKFQGWVDVDVEFEIEIQGSRKRYRNDNHRTSSHRPLRVYVSQEATPRTAGLVIGDCHTHSTYTEDQVEFGSPIEASVALCKSMGLDFFSVTDHSYDLDDRVDNYLVNDPALPKWNQLQTSISAVNNKEDDFCVLRGEEVSCRNSNGENVHLMILGSVNFIPGAGDSAERWLQTKSELSISEVLRTKEQNIVAVAAHPREVVPFLQRLLLGRGQWKDRDLKHAQLDGIQFANGSRDFGYDEGYKAWTAALLSGKRLIAFGGNDAHGNFNRFRQIGIPFLLIREMDRQLFGKMRTGVYLDGKITERELLKNMKLGRAIVTDGPVVNIVLAGSSGQTNIGSTNKLSDASLTISARSSTDFGSIDSIKVWIGKIGDGSESVLREERYENKFRAEMNLRLPVTRSCYIRAEVTTTTASFDTQPHFVLSNPVWFSPE